jgi:hypothetical protein
MIHAIWRGRSARMGVLGTVRGVKRRDAKLEEFHPTRHAVISRVSRPLSYTIYNQCMIQAKQPRNDGAGRRNSRAAGESAFQLFQGSAARAADTHQ